MELALVVLLIYILYFEFRPIKYIKIDKVKKSNFVPVNLFQYNVITHVHTQFSFDSLGKPSDIKKAMEENKIDFVFITDHDNTDYKSFEDDKVFSGIEKNTQDGRLLLLGNKLPVISHPHNFDFEHYRWKGEFKDGYLYEFIDIKDIVVWNKFITGLALIKNILIYPITRNIIHKWNSLIPIDKWRELYYSRAKHLNIIGGLDLHVKVVYQERTHGILVPSYKSGFKWLINKVYSRNPLKTKDEVLESLSNGNLYLAINQKFIDIYGQDEEGVKILGESVKVGGILKIKSLEKSVSILYHNNNPVLKTDKEEFTYSLTEEGFYHLEVYEYDFKIFNLYFGFRPVVITNKFKVVS
ncbi:PHP domain-containing protein [Sulfurihydrogenibium sp.]|uniref:PHP domain-containing protein n=1 Tax=Sulfurihydrogenibium sp. TaxID=2053621 RepID=UPI00261FC825|nr:PHP domain-containing protein [Sulfurihydrogenibium sp.]